MEELKVAEALTYLNQLDSRIDLNDTASDMWFYAIGHMDFQKVIWIIRDYYANAKPGFSGGVPPLTPGMLKSRMNEMEDRAESKQRALEPPKNKAPHPISFRKRDPERWDRLVEQGRQEHLADLQRRGIITQATLNEGGFTHGGEQ